MIVVVAGETQVVAPDEPLPRPYIEPEQRFGVMLVGVDGSTWDLYDGPVRLLSGSTGFGAANVEHAWSDLAGLDGSTWASFRTPRRELQLPVYSHHDTAAGWLDIDSAFAAAVDPSGECQLVVATPDAEARTLRVRFTGGGDPALDVDSLLLRYGAYPLTFTAVDPFWRGPRIARIFRTVEQAPFYPMAPLRVTSSDSAASASITNPGNVAVHPVYTLGGAFSAVRVTVGDAVVAYGPVAAGETNRIVVDTHPARQTVKTAGGADAWAGLTGRNFASIPRGVDVPIGVELTNPGVGAFVKVELPGPGYRRAW